MLYLLWGLINIGLFLFFVVTCFRATKLIREKFGLFACIIFVIGLLSFVSKSKDDKGNFDPHTNQIRTWKFTPEDSLAKSDISFMTIDLEKSLISKYMLGIYYGKDKQGQLKLISAYSSNTGFISGTNWKPVSVNLIKKDDNNFDYQVAGIIEWKLLSTRIYSQLKEYKGNALIK